MRDNNKIRDNEFPSKFEPPRVNPKKIKSSNQFNQCSKLRPDSVCVDDEKQKNKPKPNEISLTKNKAESRIFNERAPPPKRKDKHFLLRLFWFNNFNAGTRELQFFFRRIYFNGAWWCGASDAHTHPIPCAIPSRLSSSTRTHSTLKVGDSSSVVACSLLIRRHF